MDRNLITKLSKHGEKKEFQPMFQHFWSCEEFNWKLNLDSSAEIFSDARAVDHMEHVYNGDNFRLRQKLVKLKPMISKRSRL